MTTPGKKLAIRIKAHEENFRVAAIVIALIAIILIFLQLAHPSSFIETTFAILFTVLVPLLWKFTQLTDYLLLGPSRALSTEPQSIRAMPSDKLIAREDDLSWLRETEGDLVIVGQPGSGKTFLLRKFVEIGAGLFSISDNRKDLFDEIRSEKPTSVIVDDAHFYKQRLCELVSLRRNNGLDYRIIASSWPYDNDELVGILGLGNSSVRYLKRLKRDEIVEVIRSVGLRGPNELVRILVDQSVGRPGLAVTLSTLCLNNGLQDVVLGDAIARDISQSVGKLLGKKSLSIIAAFSIGGDEGMDVKSVGEFLGLSPLEINDAISHLSAGGVISVTPKKYVVVRPKALRASIVRDVIFAEGTSWNLTTLLGESPEIEQSILTLIHARAGGARIDDKYLLPLIKTNVSDTILDAWASLGKDEACWAIDAYPEMVKTFALSALRSAPEQAIPALLESSLGDKRARHSTPEHPMRIIKDWIESVHPGKKVAVENRKTLAEEAMDWLEKTNEEGVAMEALCYALSPIFHDTSLDPGAGRTITWRNGILTLAEICELTKLWPIIVKVISRPNYSEWTKVIRLLHIWAHPQRLVPGKSVSDDIEDCMTSAAQTMFDDLLKIGKGHNGVMRKLIDISGDLGMRHDIEIDPIFNKLFPLGKHEAQQKQVDLNILSVSAYWEQQDPKDVVKSILQFEAQSYDVGIDWPDLMPQACRAYSETLTEPLPTSVLLIEGGASSRLVLPFIQAAVSKQAEGWEELAVGCLHQSQYRVCGLSVILGSDIAQDESVSEALHQLNGYEDWVSIECLRKNIDKTHYERILEHTDASVACAAAVGIWEGEPEGKVLDNIRDIWRHALLKCSPNESQLPAILNREGLSLDWISLQMVADNNHLFPDDSTVGCVLDNLTVSEKSHLIDIVPESALWIDEFLFLVIGDNTELFQKSLSRDMLENHHLAPLNRKVDANWLELAKVANSYGYQPEAIVDATGDCGWDGAGSYSHIWRSAREQFANLFELSDQYAHELAEIGIAKSDSEVNQWKEKDELEDVYGRYC